MELRQWQNFDKLRHLLTIFGTNYLDNPCDCKIVTSPINTCTTLRNADVIVTSLKNALDYQDDLCQKL